MNQIIEGTVRRIGYNPYRGDSFSRSNGVILYLEGESGRYFISDIARDFTEAVILTKPGDAIVAELRKPDDRYASGTMVVKWTNKTFEAEQAALEQGLEEPGADQASTPSTRTSVLYSELFHGVMYYFTSAEDLERARQVDMETGLGINPFEDELDSRRIKWSTKPESLR